MDAVRMTGMLEPRGGWEARQCSIAKALDVVSTRTAFLILREAHYGATRFDEFAERAGASEPVTAARLRELVAAGLLVQEAYKEPRARLRERVAAGLLVKEPYKEPGQRTRHAYRLTAKGQELLPALVALMQWG